MLPSPAALAYRIKSGWEIERAISSARVIEPCGRKGWAGKVFGKLTATDKTRVNGRKLVEVLFVCKCGNQVWRAPLKRRVGEHSSCGCTRQKVTDKEKRKLKRETRQRFREKNRERLRQYARQWKSNNRDKVRKYIEQRSVPQLTHTHPAAAVKFAEHLAVCLLCGSITKDHTERQYDHINPVSRGGDNSPENIQVICTLCKQQKHSRNNLEFLSEYIKVSEPFRFYGHSLIVCQHN